jgi:hypothetical protein
MRKLSPSGQQAVSELAERHHFSREAVTSMLESVLHGNGTMAQFNHAEFGGSGQWMRGGMTMVSDMFNDSLKGRIDALCSELSSLVANDPGVLRSETSQSQTQNSGEKVTGHGADAPGAIGASSIYQRENASGPAAPVSLFVPPVAGLARQWWPADLGSATSTGSQDEVRYAYFAPAHRLAIEMNGRVTLYNTLDHEIGGFSQQQSFGGSLSFHSQHGLVDVASLPVVGRDSVRYENAGQPASPQPDSSLDRPSAGDGAGALATIEKLADLHAKGILSDEEFAAKKAELLRRL